jgi:hypothetical protein
MKIQPNFPPNFSINYSAASDHVFKTALTAGRVLRHHSLLQAGLGHQPE